MTIAINFQIEDLTKKPFKFTDIESLKDFSTKEAQYWKEQWSAISSIGNRSQHQYVGVHSIWQGIYQTLEGWKENFKTWDEQTTKQNLNNQVQHWRTQLNGRWVWSGNPCIIPWVESYKISQTTGDAFIESIINKSSNFNALTGQILAYEFQMQDECNLTKRRTAEEKSFSRLRNQLSDKKDELISQVVNFQEEMTTWKDTTQKGFETWENEEREGFSTWKNNEQEEFSSWRTEQERLYAEEHKDRGLGFDRDMDAWINRVNELESTYHEKLRLAKPAEYWNKRANKLSNEGMNFAKTLIVLIFIGVMYFSYLFVNWLSGIETTISLHGFQGAVLLTVIISAFIFLIKVLSKLTFSSFHLQRDAEEREQLAYVYLALVNEAAADNETRKIVLQSLFSRAETGLLTGESGPTMPISDIASIVSKAGKP